MFVIHDRFARRVETPRVSPQWLLVLGNHDRIGKVAVVVVLPITFRLIPAKSVSVSLGECRFVQKKYEK